MFSLGLNTRSVGSSAFGFVWKVSANSGLAELNRGRTLYGDSRI